MKTISDWFRWRSFWIFWGKFLERSSKAKNASEEKKWNYLSEWAEWAECPEGKEWKEGAVGEGGCGRGGFLARLF